MKVAIVGATGMLGHHTAEAAVAAGHAVHVVHRAGSRLDRLAGIPFTSAVGDLDDAGSLASALAGCEGAVLSAGYYPTTPRPLDEELATARGQADRFFGACEKAGVERIVYVGGSLALGRDPDGKPATEALVPSSPPSDPTPYVQVKWALDDAARSRAARGLPVMTAIPAMTFGEHDHGPTTGRLIVEIANRTLPAYVAGDRNVVYAGDAGRGIVAALDVGVPGQRYLLTGENLSMDALVPMIARAAGVPTPRRIPMGVARFGAALQHFRWQLGGPEPKVTKTALAVLAKGQFLDGSKAERELGYAPKVSVETAIQRALDWFRSVGMVTPA